MSLAVLSWAAALVLSSLARGSRWAFASLGESASMSIPLAPIAGYALGNESDSVGNPGSLSLARDLVVELQSHQCSQALLVVSAGQATAQV